MKIGLVGKPSAGKSTFFKAATLAEVDIANYPFTTIKPNTGVGYVGVECADKEFGVQCNPREGFCMHGRRFVPIELIDVAGLVPGASEGKGMGNQFLDDLRQADVLIHVIDCSGSTNEQGESVEKLSHDPAKDVIFLEKELDAWYTSILKKGWDRFARQTQQEKKEIHKALAKQLSGLGVTEEMVDDVLKRLEFGRTPSLWSPDMLELLAGELRKITKPMVIACNKIDVDGAKENYERLRKEFSDRVLIPCSAESELALREAARHGMIEYVPGSDKFEITAQVNEKQQKALEFIKKIVDDIGSTGVQNILDKAVLDVLGYIAIFPGGVNNLTDKDGNVLPDCFLLKRGSTALEFAYKIHTDIGRKFVKAINVKTKLPVGKDAPLNHRDVIEIKTSN